jgi:hypothetical protein
VQYHSPSFVSAASTGRWCKMMFTWHLWLILVWLSNPTLVNIKMAPRSGLQWPSLKSRALPFHWTFGPKVGSDAGSCTLLHLPLAKHSEAYGLWILREFQRRKSFLSAGWSILNQDQNIQNSQTHVSSFCFQQDCTKGPASRLSRIIKVRSGQLESSRSGPCAIRK